MKVQIVRRDGASDICLCHEQALSKTVSVSVAAMKGSMLDRAPDGRRGTDDGEMELA